MLVGRVTRGRDAWLSTDVTIRADGHCTRGGDDLHMGRGSTAHIAHCLYLTLIGDHVTVGANAFVHAFTVHDDNMSEEDLVILDSSVIETASITEAGSVFSPRCRVAGGWLDCGKRRKPLRELAPAELAARRTQLRARN